MLFWTHDNWQLRRTDMNLNGLQSTPPKRPGLLQRLSGRPVKENALIEITNLLAENAIPAVSMPQVADILQRHDLGFGECKPQFVDLVRRVLSHVAEDRELSPEDRGSLSHLQMIFELGDDDVMSIREAVLAELFSKSLADALADGHITVEERKRLDTIATSFGLPQSRTDEIYKSQVLKLLQWTFDQVVTDRRVTAEEEANLQAMAANLGVTLGHDAKTLALLDRFRLLARIDAGDLPMVTPSIKLQRGEMCHATLACTHSEIRQQTTSYRHGGISASGKIIGPLRWRVGQVAVQRVTRDVMTFLDSGTLYITNKRLLFDGSKKNTVIALSKIVHFTLFSDGLRIEKDTGRDQYFVGDGDLEVLGAVLERVITAGR